MRKNIGFVIYSLNAGGAERVLSALANELSRDYKIFIITLIKSDPFYYVHPDINIRYCANTGVNSKNSFYAIFNNLKYSNKIATIVRNEKIDLLIGFTTTANVVAILASLWAKSHCIISERDHPILYAPNKFWRIIRSFLYRYADYLVVQTKANKSYYKKLVPEKKIALIPNPIAKILEDRRQLPIIENEEKIILSVGRLDVNKSQDLLICAFANIPNKGWKLQLVGDGTKKNDFIELAAELCIDQKVNFLGNKTNIEDYYDNATVFAFTSKSEGFPNALMEALYFGIPCISTDCPDGPSDLIENGENGFLIEVGNQKQLEEKLIILMEDKKLRERFSEKAIRYTERLEMKHIVKDWKVYICGLI